jgi:hypothetical protein
LLGGKYSLITILISHNQLYGPLPDDLYSWIPGVEVIDISYNNFTGTISSIFATYVFISFFYFIVFAGTYNDVNGHFLPLIST